MKNPSEERRPDTETMSEDDIVRTMLRPETEKETFFLLYARLIEMRLKPVSLTYEDVGVLRLTKDDQQTYLLYLENLWITCQEDLENRAETIDHYLRVAVNLGKPVSITHETLIPWVKDQDYVDQFIKDSDVAHQHLAANLWIVYASQQEGSSSSVTNREISDLGIAKEELLPLAIANLKRILPPIEVEDFGSWSLMWAGSDYVPSLLLFEELWDQIASTTAGDLVAAVPVSDSLFFTSTNSPEGISHIRKRALALVAEGDHVVSSTLLRRTATGWTALD